MTPLTPRFTGSLSLSATVMASKPGIEMNTTPNLEDFEVYQNLVFQGPATDHPLLRGALVSSLAPPWRHAVEKEKALSANLGTVIRVWAFERVANGDGIAPATVYLGLIGTDFKVTNIVPSEANLLSSREHNEVLQDFELLIAAPAAVRAGFVVETTAP
jgi:hypothetical protein